MWNTLSPPWQEAIDLAWQAYCANTIPIGAVVTDANGKVVARGRNRIFDQTAPARQVHGDMLAHAELNALLALELDQHQRHSSALYTTMEPCPLCMGALYMSSVRTIHYAARDPYAGSINLLGATPYLSRKPIHVVAPFNPIIEAALVAMMVETEIWTRGETIIASRFFEKWREVLPNAVELGISLYRSGELRTKKSLMAKDVINWLANQVL